MTRITDNTSKRPPAMLSPKYAAGIAIAALLALGSFAAPANAERDGDNRGENHNWNGGYYNAPPVVYGSPYGSSYYGYSPYYAPPVVYGPGVGVSLPGINIGIR
jgi:hypothetical protein